MTREARIPRFYQAGNVMVGESLQLDKRISHHLVTVLRARDNSQIIIFNEHAESYLCSITLDGKRAIGYVSSKLETANESPLHITLVQAISRGSNMDSSIQKSVELGVDVIQPVYTRHSVPVLQGSRSEKKHAHWQSVIVSACEQSGRSKLAQLGTAMQLHRFLEQLEPRQDELRWVLSPASAMQSADSHTYSRAIVAIGPESGFEQDEVNAMKNAGFAEHLLGPRILRTETAGPAAISVLQTLYGDFG